MKRHSMCRVVPGKTMSLPSLVWLMEPSCLKRMVGAAVLAYSTCWLRPRQTAASPPSCPASHRRRTEPVNTNLPMSWHLCTTVSPARTAAPASTASSWRKATTLSASWRVQDSADREALDTYNMQLSSSLTQ